MKREVWVSSDLKNWIYLYMRKEGKYYTVNNKQVNWVTAHTPSLLFPYAKVIDRNYLGEIIHTEIRELT